MAQPNQGSERNPAHGGEDANLGRDSRQQERGQADPGRQQQGSDPAGGQSQRQRQPQQDQDRSRSRVHQDELDARNTSNRGEV